MPTAVASPDSVSAASAQAAASVSSKTLPPSDVETIESAIIYFMTHNIITDAGEMKGRFESVLDLIDPERVKVAGLATGNAKVDDALLENACSHVARHTEFITRARRTYVENMPTADAQRAARTVQRVLRIVDTHPAVRDGLSQAARKFVDAAHYGRSDLTRRHLARWKKDIHHITIDDLKLAFLLACAGGHHEVVVQLLEATDQRRMDVHFDHERCFKAAAQSGSVETVRALLELGGERLIDVNQGTPTGFEHACCKGHLGVVQQLLALDGERMVHVGDRKEWAFKAACKHGHTDVVVALLALDADRIPTTWGGLEPGLRLACENGHDATAVAIVREWRRRTEGATGAGADGDSPVVEEAEPGKNGSCCGGQAVDPRVQFSIGALTLCLTFEMRDAAKGLLAMQGPARVPRSEITRLKPAIKKVGLMEYTEHQLVVRGGTPAASSSGGCVIM